MPSFGQHEQDESNYSLTIPRSARVDPFPLASPPDTSRFALPPSNLRTQMSEDTFDNLDASKQPLLELVRQHVDDRMLRHIAATDRGEDFEAHLASLRAVVGGTIPIPMDSIPKEVLELACHREPANDREHWMRLFAGMTLLQAAEPPHHERFLGQAGQVLGLTKSAMLLGDDCSLALRSFLGWCLRRQPREDWLDPYLAIAIVILSVRLDDVSQPILDHCIAVVRSGQTEVWELFDRHHCVGSKEWTGLIRETLVEPAALAEQIRNFGSYLLLESELA